MKEDDVEVAEREAWEVGRMVERLGERERGPANKGPGAAAWTFRRPLRTASAIPRAGALHRMWFERSWASAFPGSVRSNSGYFKAAIAWRMSSHCAAWYVCGCED